MCECLAFLKEYFAPILNRVGPECLGEAGFQRNELRELRVELGGADVYYVTKKKKNYVTTYIKISRCSGVCEFPFRFPPFEQGRRKASRA